MDDVAFVVKLDLSENQRIELEARKEYYFLFTRNQERYLLTRKDIENKTFCC